MSETRQPSESARLLVPTAQSPMTPKTDVEMSMTSGEEKPMRIEKGRGWVQCFFLRRRFFVGMALTFSTFIAALEALHAYSNQNNGFVTAIESQALLWQYGPVLALSLIAGIWGQLEYSAARALPWLQLRRKPLPPDKNILLNYVSPWSIASLFRSLLAGNFPVTIATFGSLLLKVAIVVSTGLLSLEQRRLSYPTKLNLEDNFNMTKAIDGRSESPMDLAFILKAVTEQGEPYPRGVTPDVAALSVSFNTSDSKTYLGPNMNLTAAVPVFQTDLEDCEPFSWLFNNSNKRPGQSLSDMGMPSADVEKLSSFCFAFRMISDNATGPLLTNDSSTYELDSLVLVFKHPVCRSDPGDPDAISDIRDIEEFRLFTSVVVDHPDNTSAVTALLCTPRHSITRRRVTSSDGYITSVPSEVIETLDLKEPSSVVTASLFGRLRFAGFDLSSSSQEWQEPWFRLMNYIAPQDESRNYADLKTFETAFRRTWKTASAIAVKLDNMVPAANVESVEATIDFTAGRLVVVPVPLRVVETTLVVLVVGLLVLAVFDFSSVKESPPSLLNSAVVLSNSEELERRMLSDVSPATPQRFGEFLHGHLFGSRLDGRGLRVVVDRVWQHDFLPDFRAPSTKRFGQWWLPTAATRGFRIGILLATVVLFVLLEVLFQLSSKNRGLADLTTSRWARYSYNWAPAIAVSGLGLAYVATDRAVRELHVFTQLSRVNRPTNLDTLKFEANANISPVALVRVLRRQYHGLAALVICSILASTLTISASGLFVAETVPRSEPAELQPLSWFDIRNASESTFVDPSPFQDHQDALYNQGIQFHNISAPAGIYGPFAFAALDSKWLNASPASRHAKLHSRIPAVRSQANCTLYSHQPILRNVTRSSFEVKVTPPPGCTPGRNERLSDGKYIHLSANAGQAPHSGFFGFISRLSWNLLPIAHDNKTKTYTPVNRDPYTICADSIQHTWIHYGRYDEDAFEVHDLTVLQCIPFVEALEVEATFNLPDFTVDTTAPPKPARSPIPWTARNRTLNSIPFTGPLPFAGTGMNNDNFFSVLTRGRNGVPGNDLLGRDKVDAMIAKVNEVYQELSAVFLHANCRVSLDDNNGTTKLEVVEGRPVPSPIKGEVLSFGDLEVTIRLVQKEIPTRLLEGLLLCMACLGILGFWIVGDLKVLPRDPGSVAAEMSLFAGSRMVERLREEGEPGLEGERLRLGWWDKGGGEADGPGEGRRYGVDIVGGHRAGLG